MISSAGNLSLTRRLLGYYLMFALAGLFACILMTMYLAVQNDLMESSQLILLAPFVLVGAGAWALHRILRVSASIDGQLKRIHASGSLLDAQLALVPDAAPQAHGWNSLVQQVREQADQAALESQLTNALSALQQHAWQQVFNSLPEGVVAVDRSGCVTRANQCALALLGIEDEAHLIGRNFVECLAARLPDESAAALAGVREGSGALHRELARGAEVAAGVWRAARQPIVASSAGDGGAVWMLRDITQAKLAEQMRNQFVFTAAHELRTPLANIKAYAETLATRAEIDLEQQKGFYNIINAEATRLARFVDDLLDLSQIESGALSFVRTEVDIERVLTEVVEHVAPQIKQKQMRFVSSYPPKFPKVFADKDKLSAALLNLVGNALKYTPDGGQVALEVQADATQISFRVDDSGIGIKPEDLARLGDKFFRSSDARVRAVNGSGLGLAFTQEVANRHGGTLTIASELDKGSSFTLSIPLS